MMQQAIQFSGNQSALATAESPVGITDNGFVINLASSTTPVPLPQSTHPELQRFRFFVSRRREDGRERFRLHMGYFSTQEEAERLLELVREVYPAAWAGVAPGQKLRAQQAAQSAQVAPEPTVSVPSVAVAVPPPVAPAAPVVVKPAVIAAPAKPQPPPQPLQLQVVAAADTHKPVTVGKPAATTEQMGAAQSLSSVRAAIASLDTTAERKAVKARSAPASQPPLTGAQVLKVLEPARPVSAARPALVKTVTKPAPTKPAAAIRPRDELTMYAVQLMWSVQPIAMSAVPQLAIFSAYTLYGAEGSRDDRRWYGLRLGFFTDATSAKQVAHYVRSEFASVSVVPVTVRERERALAAAQKAAAAPAATTAKASSSGEFKLIDDKPASALHPAAARPAMAGKQPPGKRVKVRAGTAKKSGAAKSKREISLEETLEILGASELQIDNGRGELLNESGVRHLRLEADKSPRGSKLGRLIDRLSESFGD